MTDPDFRPWPLCYETNNYSPALTNYFSEPVRSMPSLTDQLSAAATHGFAFVGLDMGSVQSYLEEGHSPADLRPHLHALGLRCLEVAELSVTADEHAVATAARPLIDIATAVEAQFIQISVFGDLSAAAASARRLESLLDGSDIGIGLEFLPFSPIDSISAARRFIGDAGLRRTRMVLDNWHFFHGPDRWSDLETLKAGEIAYVQFSDHRSHLSGELLHETVNHRLLPGDGQLDLARFCAAVVRSGFEGVISVEVLSGTMRQWSPDAFAKAEYETARRYWSNL